MYRLLTVLACLFAIVSCGGCTHIQLRKRTNQQLRTTAEITQQQIMDNVAKIACNENAWPDYSNVSAGQTQLVDGGGATLGLTWDARTIIQEALGLSASREVTEQWTTSVIIDPDRLRAMWAVYHYSIYGSVPNSSTYSADLQLTKIFGNDWQKMIPTPGWFKSYCEHDFCEKVHCGCVVGHACDSHACVLPGHEQDLQQLTYLIMYIATMTVAGNQPFPSGIPTPTAAIPPPEKLNTKEMAAPPETESVPTNGKLPNGPARDFNLIIPGITTTPSGRR